MTQVPYTLRVLAGETETRYGERLYHSGAVHIVEKSAKRLSCKVADGRNVRCGIHRRRRKPLQLPDL